MALAHICLKSSSASCLSLSLASSTEEDVDSVEVDMMGTRGHPKMEKSSTKVQASVQEGRKCSGSHVGHLVYTKVTCSRSRCLLEQRVDQEKCKDMQAD